MLEIRCALKKAVMSHFQKQTILVNTFRLNKEELHILQDITNHTQT